MAHRRFSTATSSVCCVIVLLTLSLTSIAQAEERELPPRPPPADYPSTEPSLPPIYPPPSNASSPPSIRPSMPVRPSIPATIPPSPLPSIPITSNFSSPPTLDPSPTSTSTRSPFPSISSRPNTTPRPFAVTLITSPPPFAPDASLPENTEILRQNFEFFVSRFFIGNQGRPPRLRVDAQVVDASSPNFPFDKFPKVFFWPNQALRTVTAPSIDTQDVRMAVLVDRQQVIGCPASTCAARVIIFSDKFIRWVIISRAMKAIRRKPGFNTIFETNTNKFRIVRQGKKKFVVHIPFKKREA